MPSHRSPGQRAGLDLPAVIAAARAVVAERGRDALAMRAVARRLGVSPNALYSHVADKNALLDTLLDDALASVALPGETAVDPLAALHALMRSTYDTLLANAELVPIFVERQGARGPNAEELGRVVLELLRRAGVTEAAAADALHVLIVHAIGSAAFATGSPLPTAQHATHAARRFDRGLRWLLAGISLPTTTLPAPAPNPAPRGTH